VDPVVTAQLAGLLSRLADGALGEAGKQAWDALVRLVGRARRPEAQAPAAEPGAALTELQGHTGDPARAEAARRALEELAAADPEFAAALREWWAGTDRLIREADAGNVNVIRGDVHGGVVQARDVHGPISFGGGQPGS
jgi:hypothetical protein